MGPERCVLCGAVIPEGSTVCPACMKEYAPADEMEIEQELRDVAEVLKITANTDRNIKNSMEAILRIADRLERKRKNGTIQTQSGAGKD